MAIDDDLASFVKFDFQHPITHHGKIQIGPTGLQPLLNPHQNRVGQCLEFTVIHRCANILFLLPPFAMHRLAIAILFSTLLLGACGTRGSLTLPPPQKPNPAATVKPAPSPANTNTAKEPA